MLRHHERVLVMFNRRQLIEYACPNCNAEFGSNPEKAGTGTNCADCKTDFLIPLGIQAREVSVGNSPGRKLSPQETAAFYATHPATRGMVVRRPVPSELAPDEYDRTQYLPSPTHRPEGDDKPVELRLGRMIGMKVDVDGKTRSALATTMLGGLLVALGAIIFSKFGLKSRS